MMLLTPVFLLLTAPPHPTIDTWSTRIQRTSEPGKAREEEPVTKDCLHRTFLLYISECVGWNLLSS